MLPLATSRKQQRLSEIFVQQQLMLQAIRISTLNDFIFCPKSIYFHDLYQKYEKITYQDTPQTEGTLAHSPIDSKKYSTAKDILQAKAIYSEEYGLIGKIDLFNINKGLLIERKKKIKKIYQGYVYQLYAQYFCMIEMGYDVKKIQLYSLDDNKSYDIELPNEEQTQQFINFLEKYRAFDPQTMRIVQNPQKCLQCIYRELCDLCQR